MNTSDNDNEEFADFNPPPPPTSSGVQRTISKEPFQPQQYPSPSSFDPTLNNYKDNYGTEESVNEYYKKYIPNYSQPIKIKQLKIRRENKYCNGGGCIIFFFRNIYYLYS